MSTGQIHNMNLVPYAGSILRGVVISEYVQHISSAYRNLADKGHKIVWNIVRIFTDLTRCVGADWVEVSQQRYPPCRVCRVEVLQYLLDHEFRTTERVDGCGGC